MVFSLCLSSLDLLVELYYKSTLAMLLAYFSVYEKLFEISDIMSDVLEPCVGHCHILPDIMLTIMKTNLVMTNL